MSALSPAASARGGRLARSRLPLVYATESFGSVAGTLITMGLPFYTLHRFGWQARENLLLGAAQGVAYVVGALSAERLSARFGRTRALATIYLLLVVLNVLAAAAGVARREAPFVALMLAEMAAIAASWPMVESLVSTGASARDLSRRLGLYNVNWASFGALALAGSGWVLERGPAWGFFAVGAAAHASCAALMLTLERTSRGDTSEFPLASAEPRASTPAPRLDPERGRLALVLARICLPATYVIVYALAPLLPSLALLQRLSPARATLLASGWLVARALAFVVTGRTTFWQRRPELLLWAAVVMTAAFLGTIGAGSWPGRAPAACSAMLAAELALGLSLGLIYAASLYFGMVVSEGSTEHGGYHEALIGLGQTLGPATGATMLWLRPGDLWFGVVAVCTVPVLSILAGLLARARARRPPRVAAPPVESREDCLRLR